MSKGCQRCGGALYWNEEHRERKCYNCGRAVAVLAQGISVGLQQARQTPKRLHRKAA